MLLNKYQRYKRMKAYRIAAGSVNVLWGARAVKIFERNSKVRFDPSNISHWSIVANAGETLHFFHSAKTLLNKDKRHD